MTCEHVHKDYMKNGDCIDCYQDKIYTKELLDYKCDCRRCSLKNITPNLTKKQEDFILLRRDE